MKFNFSNLVPELKQYPYAEYFTNKELKKSLGGSCEYFKPKTTTESNYQGLHRQVSYGQNCMLAWIVKKIPKG